jgi:hypothetical protein
MSSVSLDVIFPGLSAEKLNLRLLFASDCLIIFGIIPLMTCSQLKRMVMMAMARANDPGYEGLRILARMIARVYLDELAQERINERSQSKNKEEDDANQRCKRGYKAAAPGENQTGNQEGKH